MANSPEILALGPNNCFARWNNLLVQWWHETRLEAVDEHMAVLAPFPAGAVEHRATGNSKRGHENLPLAALLC